VLQFNVAQKQVMPFGILPNQAVQIFQAQQTEEICGNPQVPGCGARFRLVRPEKATMEELREKARHQTTCNLDSASRKIVGSLYDRRGIGATQTQRFR
jgi:hypothetical protein